MGEIKQMDLRAFREVYGIPENTAREWVHSKGFPAYKLGMKWYVDIPAFEKWRKEEHQRSYKYA